MTQESDADFTLTAAVTTEVPTFYDPPEPDAFVLPPAEEPEPIVLEVIPLMELPAEEPVADGEPAEQPTSQWVYTGNGLGAWFGPDGNNIEPGVYYHADPETRQPLEDLFA